ncbi:hypothetical protein ACWENQ_21865 [Nonomuraea sp. NPDC004354]
MTDAALTGAQEAQQASGGSALRLPQVAPEQSAASSPSVMAAPLARELAVSPAKPQAARRTDLTTGLNGLPYVGGGILVLLAALWGVARAQRSRGVRKSQPMS